MYLLILGHSSSTRRKDPELDEVYAHAVSKKAEPAKTARKACPIEHLTHELTHSNHAVIMAEKEKKKRKKIQPAAVCRNLIDLKILALQLTVEARPHLHPGHRGKSPSLPWHI